MKKRKFLNTLVCLGLSTTMLCGCGTSSVSESSQATPENPMILSLAHGLSESHTVHIAMTEFAEEVKEKTMAASK